MLAWRKMLERVRIKKTHNFTALESFPGDEYSDCVFDGFLAATQSSTNPAIHSRILPILRFDRHGLAQQWSSGGSLLSNSGLTLQATAHSRHLTHAGPTKTGPA